MCGTDDSRCIIRARQNPTLQYHQYSFYPVSYTHLEEHLDVYNFKKKERKKEVQTLEQEKEYLTAENEGLTAQITEARADIQLLKDDKEQAVKDKEEAEKRAEKDEKDLCSLEERRERLQPVMDLSLIHI